MPPLIRYFSFITLPSYLGMTVAFSQVAPNSTINSQAPTTATSVAKPATGSSKPVPKSSTGKSGSTTTLKTIVVTATEVGYSASEASTATRTDTPIAQTPLSIQVVPSQVIEDQDDVRLKDVIRNVSGVAPSKTEGNGIQFETAYIRGFSQLTYVDAVQFYTMPTTDLAGVQRIEVLKGPASSMYGGMEPGGLINVIPKLPEPAERSEVSGEFGSYGFYRGDFDTTGPINDQLNYRLEGSFQDSDSFRNFLHQQSEFIAPSLTWNPTADTRVTTWLWYQDLERPQDQGVVFSYKGQPVGPISQNLAGPNNANTQFINDLVYNLQVDQKITPDLTFQSKFLMHNFDGHEDAIRWSTVSATNRISPYFDGSHFNDWQFDLVNDIDWHVDAGPTKHEILFGTELNRNDYYYDRMTDTNLPTINIYNPIYPVGPFPLTPGVAEQHTLTDNGAVFLQDQMGALDDRLHLLLGGRVDHVAQSYVAFSNGMHYKQEDLGYSGRAGLMYDVTPWASPYVNIDRSFNPNTAGSNLTYSGNTLPPTSGLQYEAGVKWSFFEKRIALTSDVYQITKSDVAVADAAHPGFSLDGGELRSRGLEFDLTGQITPELQLIGNYAYTDTKVLQSNTLPVGASFINIPPNSGSLWLNYTFQDGPLKDFGLGIGGFAADRSAGDNANSFYLPGYVRLDSGMWYSFNLTENLKMKVQVNVFNMLDKRYYESSASAGSVEPGEPLSVMGKCSIIF